MGAAQARVDALEKWAGAMDDIGWDFSAPGWLDAMGDRGDATRRHVLDAPMLAALPDQGRVIDIGCGEGRFCRMMNARGLEPVGLDPTSELIGAAKSKDPAGSYVQASGEALPFENECFDAAVFYLSLIDIPDFRSAIAEAARVLRPGGLMLVANLHAHATARPRDWPGEGGHWVIEEGVHKHLAVDEIQLERGVPTAWDGIRITNYHRPLSAYLGAFLAAGLTLRQFEDPPFTGPEGEAKEKFRRAPWAFFMSWEKP